jgi:hypothetical protein
MRLSKSLHWYLAIIYQPEYVLQSAQPTPSPLTRKRKRDEELLVEASKPNTTVETPEGNEVEAMGDSESSSPKMEFEDTTESDYANRLEEWELEYRLCEAVCSVSLEEQEEPHYPVGKLGYLSLTPNVDKDDSFDHTATSMEGFNESGPIPSKSYSKKTLRTLASGRVEGGTLGPDVNTGAEATSLKM